MINKSSRRSITVEKILEDKIRVIQANLIKSDSNSWSYNDVVTAILLAGIMGSNSLKSNEWSLIKRLLEGKKIDLDFPVDEYIVQLSKLGNLE